MSLTERIEQNLEVTQWRGKIPVYYRYTYGLAGERFFREIKDNAKFLGTKCERCDLVYVPPRIYCERCFEELTEYIEVGQEGTVHTFTICYEKRDGSRSEEPSILAMVRIDKTNGGIVHRLGEVDPKKVYIGMAVRAVFRPKGQREGSILDIKYFKPA